MTKKRRGLQPGDDVTVAVYKADGRRRFTVRARCHSVAPDLLVLHGEPGRAFETAAGVTRLPTATVEYFPVGRWWNIVSFFSADTGELVEHFCNILIPATWVGGELRYVDLDLDLVVRGDGTTVVEDIAEFRAHAREWRYSSEVRRQALAELRELRSLAESRHAPFTTDSLPAALARAREPGFSIPAINTLATHTAVGRRTRDWS